MEAPPPIPRDPAPDSTLALARDGYAFIMKRCRRYGSDLFETRLLFRKTICVMGEEAARVFYDPRLFERKGAMPARVKKTLLGEGGVQGLDGEAHRSRKGMFMALMTPERIEALANLAADEWRAAVARWERMDEVILHDAVREILCRAVCAWAGVPLAEAEVARRTRDLGALIEAPAAVGPRYWRGRRARKRTGAWIGGLIEQVRAGTLAVDEEQALHAVAWHRDPDGALLAPRVAAVEVINVLRPTVAVARFVVFAALALHEHPAYRQKLAAGADEDHEHFVQEVRRFYPFFPQVAARVRELFTWRGHRFPAGRRVLLDLYGTNHEPRLWDEPEAFRPERFRQWDGSAFGFIPQGGGDHLRHHRCPGEWITIALMKVALRALTGAMTYEVPAQDLRVSLSRIPAIPKSRFVIRRVRRVAGGEGPPSRLTEARRAEAARARRPRPPSAAAPAGDRIPTPVSATHRGTDMDAKRTAKGLGLFSIGLGMTQLLAPVRLGRLIGVGDHPRLMRAMGAREVLHGLAILAPRRRAPGVWSRVAGDALDVGLLARALSRGRNQRGRVAGALGVVLPIGVLDLLTARRLQRA